MLSEGVTKYVLDNGLTVLIKENHASPAVAIFTYVKAGYFNEPDRLVGISHLLEHMFFKGTPRRGVGQIACETKALGGYLNASTIYEHTLYYTVLPGKSFLKGLEIQSDALINSIFNSDELKKETEVVIQEAKRKLDMPAAVAREKLFELAFDKHRIRRWRIGTETGLRALQREDVLNFHKDFYCPENIILVIVGDVNRHKAFAEIERFYNHFDKGNVKKEKSRSEPPQREFKYKCFYGDIQQGYLSIGFHTPKIFHPDSFALEILVFILGRGRSSRLFQNVKEKNNLVNTISSSNYTLKDLGVLLIEANVQPEKLRAAERAIFKEIAKMRHKPISHEELLKARNLIESTYVFALESVSGQANMLAEFEALGDYHLAEDYLNRLYRVTEEDIWRVANDYFTLNNGSLLEYLPKSSGVKPSSRVAMASAFEKSLDAKTSPHRSKSEQRALPHEIFSVISGNGCDKEIRRYKLSNGMTILIKENHQIPLVSVGVFAKGGRCHENPENAGISALTLRTALKGTRNRKASEIALAIENLGSAIHFSNDPDYVSYSMNILSKNFNAGFEILADIITDPTFPEQEVTKEKENTQALILREKDDMFHYPLTLFYSALFKNHAYGLPSHGTVQSITNLTPEDLGSWHHYHFAPDNITVVLVGDVESNAVRDLIEKRLRRLNSYQNDLMMKSDLTRPTKIETRIEAGDKEQTALVLGFWGPKYTDEDFYSLTVLQNVISGLGGRFFEELRGRQSLAYTVTAFLASRLYGGAFISYIATTPENEKRAKEGLIKEFNRLIKSPISEEELKRAIQYTVGTHQIGLETYRAQMFQYALNENLGKGVEEIQLFPEKIEKVTIEDIISAAQKYFDLSRYALGMVQGKRPRN